VKTADALQAKVAQAERSLRLVWVIAFGAIIFSMLTVTPLVQRVTPQEWDWTAPILPLVVDAAVIIVVRMDATISGLNVHAGAWPTILRWMTGLFTLALNIGDSALKGDMVGVGVHAVCPMLLIATSEAIPRYRRTIASAVDQIRREQAAEREHREQERRVREQQAREEREQSEARREQLTRERLEAEERRAREQRDHDARIAREAREHDAQMERERLAREQAERQAELERQERIRLAEITAAQQSEQRRLDEQRRREQQQREERERREQAEAAVREQARERRQTAVRERPEAKPAAAREQRPLHAVNAPKAPSVNARKAAPVNTAKKAAADDNKVGEDEALTMIRDAVNTGTVHIRGLARTTGWSVGWVSARVAELSGDTAGEAAEAGADQVPA
jgi:hypothetical protein